MDPASPHSTPPREDDPNDPPAVPADPAAPPGLPGPATSQPSFRLALELVIAENHRLLLERFNAAALETLAQELAAARRIFAAGTGRSGLALLMAAMRLMHLGLTVHVVGETTAPAIGAGDLLLAVSGSGATPAVVRAAADARGAGARVAAVTTVPASALGRGADVVVTLPAAAKQDQGGTASAQYAGSLFEQASLLTFDALFHVLARRRGQSAEQLWARHANLE